MSFTKKYRLLVFGAVAFAALLLLGSHVVGARTQAPIQVRWLLSHQPTDVFARATQVFAETLARESGGALVLKIIDPEDVGVAAGDVPNAKAFELLDSGAVELATTYTVPLGKEYPAFWSLNLPFLFDTYDNASRVLDGPVGQEILDTLASHTTAHGLAFTMSGGFRIIVSKDTKIQTLNDLKGKRIATSGGPVAEATLSALGAVPVSMDLENGNPDLFSIDGVETTYSRLSAVIGAKPAYTKYINETNHNIFLTAIIAGKSFYDSLSPKDQVALKKAAEAAALVEREDSIALGARTRFALEEKGSIITPLTAELEKAMREKTEGVYEELTLRIGRTIVESLVGAAK